MPISNNAAHGWFIQVNWRASILRILLLLLLLPFVLPATAAQAAPRLWLPTPPGETWKVIQGYGCGTHNGWDHYSLDLVNTAGRTRGAPVRAAADGTIWYWTRGSGTLILSHGDGFYTMYTHMESVVSAESGRYVARGTVIGTVGDRGSPGTPHLHFTAFTGRGISASGRQSVPLSFAEGYHLGELGGCNQHGGTTLVANGQAVASDPVSGFISSAEPNRWYNTDVRVEYVLPQIAGFSQAWNHDPSGPAPMFDANMGYMQLSWAGEGLHTLYLRTWGPDGNQQLLTYGPIGYDVTPPQSPRPAGPIEVDVGTPALLRWNEAHDAASGVAGYRIYLGPDASGTSEWFVPAAQADIGPLQPGRYFLRVQPFDYAGNSGEWTTVRQVISQ